MTRREIKDIDHEEYISVETARKRLGIGHRDMALLLEANALHYRKDPRSQSIRLVSAEDVSEALKHLARYRQEREEWSERYIRIPEDDEPTETSDSPIFQLSASDLMTLLLAAIDYFDAERDIYFDYNDERNNLHNTISVIERLYLLLEKAQTSGSVSEMVAKIYRERPNDRVRGEIFLYLMNRARQKRKSS
jgi:hypothetical protein